LLQTNEDYLLERLAPRVVVTEGKTNCSRYVVLQHKASLETWEKVKQTMATLPLGVEESKLKSQDRAFCRALREEAIFATEDQMRVYPSQSLAAHVIVMCAGKGKNKLALTGWNWNSIPSSAHPRMAAHGNRQAPAGIGGLPG